MAHDEQRWLSPRLQKAAALCNQAPAASESPLWLGIDLGTCDVVSMVVDRDGQPVAVCLDWADVVRDGIVWDFFGAVTLVRRHLATLEQQLGCMGQALLPVCRQGLGEVHQGMSIGGGPALWQRHGLGHRSGDGDHRTA